MKKAYYTGALMFGCNVLVEANSPIWADRFNEYMHELLVQASDNHNLPRRVKFHPVTEANVAVVIQAKVNDPTDHAGVLLDMLIERLATSEDLEAIKADVQAVLDSYHESKLPKPNGSYTRITTLNRVPLDLIS